MPEGGAEAAAQALCRRLCVRRISIRHRAAITATNEAALTAKHAPVPPRARRRPAITGPMARDRLNWREFSATAFWMRCLGTRLVITAW